MCTEKPKTPWKSSHMEPGSAYASELAALLGDGMEKAIREGQFVVYYQPQYNQRFNSLYGAEALVRWNHPERGMILPDAFIPFMEEHGLIAGLDEFVLKKICETQRTWLDEGKKIAPVSVNLSRAELTSMDICRRVDEILQKAHLSREYINFEIKETTYNDHPDVVQKIAREFQNMGFRVHMDGFGSSYSSLLSFKEIAVDILKLDMKFLEGQVISERGGRIIEAIVHMAHGLGMPVIAEGVEKKEQAEFLKSVGCYYMQGYYFGRPMSGEEYAKCLIKYDIDFLRNEQRVNPDDQYINGLSLFNMENILLDDDLGPGAIIEYDGTNVAIVRMNNAFTALFGGLQTVPVDWEIPWYEFMEEGYEEDFLSAIRRAIETKHVGECEVLSRSLGSHPRVFWTRRHIKYLQGFDGRYTLYLRIRDIDRYRTAFITSTQLYYELEHIQKTGCVGSLKLLRDNREIVEVNETAAAMAGYTVGEFMELVKGDAFALLREEEKEELKPLFYRELPSDPYIFSRKIHILCKDGTYREIDTIVTIKTPFSGKRYANVLWLDVYQSEGSLTQNEIMVQKRLENIIADQKILAEELNGPYIHYAMETSGILNVNDAFCNMLGYTREEFDRKSFSRMEELVCHDDIDQIIRKVYKDTAKYGEFRTCRYRMVMKDGSLKWVEAQYHPVKLSNGKEETYLLYKDIQHEKEVEESLDFLNQIGDIMDENMHNASLVYRIDGNRWTIHHLSTAFARMLGFSKEQIIKMSKNDIVALIHPDDKEYVRKEAVSHMQAMEDYVIRHRVLTSSGVYVWVESYGNTFEVGDKRFVFQYNKDITKQIKLENTLRGENERLDTIVNSIPGGIMLLEVMQNHQLKIGYASHGIAEIAGREIEDYRGIVGIDYVSNIHRNDQGIITAAIEHAVATGEEMHLSVRMIHADGHTIWMDVKGRVVGDNNGNPMVLVVFRDISSETDTLLNTVTESTVGILVSEVNSREIIYHNSITDMYGKNVFRSTLEEMSQKLIYDYLEQRTFQGESMVYEYKRNEYFFKIQLMRKNWYGRDCYICYISNMDIMTLLNKSMHLALEETDSSESIMKMLGFWGMELESARSYIYEFKDGLCNNVYEWYREGLQPANENLQGIKEKAFESWKKEFKENGLVIIKDVEEMKKNNPLLYEVVEPYELGSIMACPIYREGELYGFYGVDSLPLDKINKLSNALPIIGNFLDMLLIRKTLADASRSKTDFLSRMSHDIRTPLNGIIGLTHIMKNQAYGPELLEEYLTKVDMLSVQLQSLLNDVLDMSQIESGKIELSHETFEIYSILKEISPGLIASAEEKSVKLIGSHYDIQHPYLVGSPLHLQRIIMNVLSNAIKYNRPDGTVECWLKEIPVDDAHSDYVFTIQDTGIGMSKEFLSIIFNPFEVERSDNTHTSTGLGMSITKELVDLMGGTIKIESEQDKGTTVTIHIPFEYVDANVQKEEMENPGDLSGLHILLVEDNKINLRIARFMLENSNAQVTVAENGQEAVDLFRKSTPGSFDVILMDVMMPVLNGLDATRKIRSLERPDAGKIPIIAMTANAFQGDIRACKEAGMNDHIAKPIDIDIMIRKILLSLVSETQDPADMLRAFLTGKKDGVRNVSFMDTDRRQGRREI